MDGKMFNSQYKPILISFLLFTLLSIFSGNLCRAQDSTDAEKMHLQRHVKSILSWTYSLEWKIDEYSHLPARLLDEKELFFDTNGNLTKQIDYSNGHFSQKTEYHYDRKGFKTAEIQKNPYGKISFKTTYKKSKKGTVKIKWQGNNESGMVKQKPLDTNYTFIRITYYNKHGSKRAIKNIKSLNVDSFFYINSLKVRSCVNVNGILDNYISQFRFGKNAKIIEERNSHYSVYRYFNNKKLIEEIQTDTLGNILYKYICSYDSFGRLIAENTYNINLAQNEAYQYAYDIYGNKIKSMHTVSNSDNDLVKYPYGFIKDETIGNFHSSIEWRRDYISWEYEYDSNGNITIQYKYFTKPKKELDLITLFSIKYY